MDIAVANEWLPWFYKISPVTLAQLQALNGNQSLYQVTLEYAAMVLRNIHCLLTYRVCCHTENPEYSEEKKVNAVIEVNDVTKRYGANEVLKDVSLTCEAGKIYGLVGRNGSGKTVLLKSICGLVVPTNGEVRVWGQVVGKDVDFPENIGFIIESPGFLLQESGPRNLKHLASIRGKIGIDEVRESMNIVGLDPDLKKPVGKHK